MLRLLVVLLAVVLVIGLAIVSTGASSPASLPSTTPLAEQATPTPQPMPVPAEEPTATPPTEDPTPAPEPTATAPTEREAELRAVVDEHLGDLPGTFGVIVKDLKTGDTVAINPDLPFPAASLYKLGLMYEVLKQGQEGRIDLMTLMDIEPRHMVQSEFDEKLPVGLTVTIDRSLWFLITLSSNSAAMALNDYVSWSDVNQSMRELGLVNTRMPGDPTEAPYGDWRDETSSTTPAETLRFFDLLYEKKLLDEEASEKMMWLLENQQIDDRLSVKLPSEATIAHKTGNLSGTINNVGIIFGPQTDLYVGVMTQGADYEATTEALQDLGLALYLAANE